MKSLRGLALAAVVVLVLTLCAVAQSTSSSQEQPADQSAYPAATEQTAGEHTISAPENYSSEQQVSAPAPAPVPGHPLDPADVDTLTGKNDQRRQPGASGAAYYPYSMDNGWFNTRLFGTRFFSNPSTQFNPFLFSSFGFGGFRNFGNNGFLFAPPPGTSFFLGGPHFTTPGVMFTPGQSSNFGVPPRAMHSTGSRFGPHHRP